jgi:C-terminal processing protease CtpA/Prc
MAPIAFSGMTFERVDAMTAPPLSQKGLSFAGGLLALALVAFAVSVGLKVVPHYTDYWSVKKSIEAAMADKSILSVEALFTRVHKDMLINNIRDVDLDKALTVRESAEGFKGTLQYEQRDPLIGNLDIVVKFNHEFNVGKP